jgi:hypothetical protein
LYWSIGTRIRHEVLKDNRAQYGEQIISAVGRQLSLEYGRGFSEKTLRHMIRFAEAFPDSYGVIQPAQIDFSPLAVVLFRDAHADGRLALSIYATVSMNEYFYLTRLKP